MELNAFNPSSALLTIVLLAMAPFAAAMVTSFTKIVVVLSLLRNALGLQQVPPNVVLNGMAMILTLYVMYPVGVQMKEGLQMSNPGSSGPVALMEGFEGAKEPLRAFLIRHSSPRERAFFLRTAQQSMPKDQGAQISEHDFLVVLPSFTVSELSAAFQIGFLVFLPFLVIDLVVSNILLSMGMQMLSPSTVSLPFKLLLFVLADGWVKLAHGLVLSYI
jgi:type III secretion protein R